MKLKPYYLLILLLWGCNNADNGSLSESKQYAPMMTHEEMGAPMTAAEDASGNAATINLRTEAKIIKNANIRFKVSSIAESLKHVNTAVKKQGGYITSSTESRVGEEIVNNITIRVASPKFEALINELTGTALVVDYKNIYSEDVTENYIDTEARLKTRQQLEERYLELLKQAKQIEDIIKIEAHLSGVRAEIESYQGRLKYLNDRISESTITLEMYESLPYKAAPVAFMNEFINAFSHGWKIFLNFIIGVAAAWPFIILTAIVVWLIRKFKPFRRKNRIQVRDKNL